MKKIADEILVHKNNIGSQMGVDGSVEIEVDKVEVDEVKNAKELKDYGFCYVSGLQIGLLISRLKVLIL